VLHSAFDAIARRAGIVLRQIFHKDPAIAFSGCNEVNPGNAFGGRWAINSIWIGKIDVPLRDVTGLGSITRPAALRFARNSSFVILSSFMIFLL
jgi:hypothetical protein